VTTAIQFLNGVIRPVLHDMDMWSKSAERLLLMTASHESGGFKHRKQVGGGPALSFYQIEPDTLRDLYRNHLSFHGHKREAIRLFELEGFDTPEIALLDDKYATAAARLIYSRCPEPLPDAADLENLGRYCKSYWNTDLGKATPQKYVDDFMRYAGDTL